MFQPPVVLATVLLDPPVALAFGCLVALASSRLIARAPEREIGRTVAFAAGWGAFYGLGVAWFYFTYPDWMLAYLKDAREVALVPSYLIFLAVTMAHGAMGGLVGAIAIARGKRGWAWAMLALALGTYAGVFWLQWRQYFEFGTYAEYVAGRAGKTLEDPAWQRASNLAAGACGLAALAVLALRIRQGRRDSTGQAVR